MIEWIAAHPEYVAWTSGALAIAAGLVLGGIMAARAIKRRKRRDRQFRIAMHDYRRHMAAKREDETAEEEIIRQIR